MEEKKKTFVTWVKKHKTELIIAGISVVAIIAVILGAKNNETLEEVWASLKNMVEKEPKEIPYVALPQVPEAVHISDVVVINTTHTEQIPHDVSEHIRNLHEGWKASTEKIATAAERGYDLKPGQTWVEAYTKGMTAA